jgi:peptide-methionine (S)-S-oxide reductase
MFWQVPGVYTTHVGYSGGHSLSPSYEQVCTGQTGHAEVVRVVYDPRQVHLKVLLKVFWEGHDPTQVNGQGNDIGTQYRSAIFVYNNEQLSTVNSTRSIYQRSLEVKGFGEISTEIRQAGEFYYAEDYHQQYLHTRPNGYCGHRKTGAKLDITSL